ncbi:Capsular polysaccharide biosynthesis protein [ANME-1 cluster archaeon GoMg3.2]|nr:Capsular polysaccharide biosynthesis protein [ANME-1 cluster archaeon GoMg3.2]
MISRDLFILAHQIGDRNFYPEYKRLVQNQWKSYEELKEEQEKQLRYMINFAYKNVPYYHNLFNDLKLSPDDVRRVDDLEKLPILTKDIIKQNWKGFKPVNLNKMKYYEAATGGSTGTPFKYRLYKFDRFLGGAMLYKGWGYGGYGLGDKTVFLAGASLDIGTKSYLAKRVHEIARNIKKLSSFDMGEKEMNEYVKIVNSFKPKFIRGYASSIYFFAKWLEENDIEMHHPFAVFTTAEKLYPNMREKIGDIFNCEVYDAYGLNDGGIGAYECSEHSGLHIDTERSIMEVVDKNGNPLENGEGEILATSLYNYAMPFIRYDTGDLGYILPGNERCGCGRAYRLLKELVGRNVDIFVTPEGKNVHGWFFLYIFWEFCKGVKEYQVVQEKLDKIVIKIVPEEGFDEKQLDKIREIIRTRSEGWNVEFKFVDQIERTGAGKYKFIINEMGEK